MISDLLLSDSFNCKHSIVLLWQSEDFQERKTRTGTHCLLQFENFKRWRDLGSYAAAEQSHFILIVITGLSCRSGFVGTPRKPVDVETETSRP